MWSVWKFKLKSWWVSFLTSHTLRHRSDTSLYCDDVDIRFSKMMNSCKVLQIRYASVERLLERLTDLRFLSIDFLNTFLHSYRVFTSANVVLDKLITIYKKPISAIPARWGILCDASKRFVITFLCSALLCRWISKRICRFHFDGLFGQFSVHTVLFGHYLVDSKSVYRTSNWEIHILDSVK